jgi:uncharacterized membrane protein YeaQ/YmgE (transglycosylase-associated protein family)
VSLIAWIILGIVTGFIASRVVHGTGRDAVMKVVLGVLGAIIGGWLFNAFGLAGGAGVNFFSLLIAALAAALLLIVHHAFSNAR